MKIQKLAALALALVPAAVAVSYSGDAVACGMSYGLEPTPQKPSPTQEVARAEKSLEAGQNVQAARTVLAAFPNVRNANAGQSAIETRALRVFALVVARSNGAVNERSAGTWTANEWTPNANLEWAIQALREIDAKRPNDPAVQADLGEALSKLSRTQGEALTLLGKLADKDLMGSPFAYAALAKLRSDKGDTTGAETAIKRCEEMSKTPGVCRPSGPAKAPATVTATAKA